MPNFGHISDDDLERLILGTITDESELAPLEEHLLVCDECIERGGGTQQFVESVGTALRRLQAKRKGALYAGKIINHGTDAVTGTPGHSCDPLASSIPRDSSLSV